MIDVGAVRSPTGVNAIPNGSFKTVATAAALVMALMVPGYREQYMLEY